MDKKDKIKKENKMSLNGKTVIVVGASGGIGRVISGELYRAGANVVLTARTENRLIAVQEEDGLDPTRSLVAPADAINAKQVANVFAATRRRFSRLGAVVITAGGWGPRLGLDESLDQALAIAEEKMAELCLSVVGVGYAAQQSFEQQKSRGWLVHLSSHVVTNFDLPGNLAYRSAKLAAEVFLDGLAAATPWLTVSHLRSAIVNTPETREQWLRSPEAQAAAVQPEAIAAWIIEHFGDKTPPRIAEFKSQVVV